MPSYQDIETRLRVVEDKIDTVMKSIIIRTQSGIIDKKIEQKTLYDLYLMAQHAGEVRQNIQKALHEPIADE